MDEIDVSALQSGVILGGFAVSALLGVVMSWSRFCTMGALSDAVNIGDWTRMRMWLCAIGVAILGTQWLALTGWIDPQASIYTGTRLLWLSNLAGGALFGFGMVLASGCGAKTLLRIGTGSLKALVVFVVMGVFAYMTLRGLFAVIRVGWLEPIAIELPRGQDLPRLFSSSPEGARLARAVLATGLGGALLLTTFANRGFRTLPNIAGSVTVGLGVVAVWYLSGHLGFIAEDPDTLKPRFLGTNSGRMESLSFVGPSAFTLEWLMLWSDTSRTITLGIATALGMIAGAFLWSIATGRFRWEGFRDTQDTADHLIGAALMGVGGVTAMGCTIGQGITGLSMLALGALIAFGGIVAGAVAAFRLQAWRMA
ncbi:MAG: putative transporter component [Pseudomonadota bacterium]|jgi:uncharacterized membrane protein YedE/YeeE